MNASKLFIAIAAVVMTGSASAADVTAASAAAISAATTAAQVSIAVQRLNVPVVLVNRSAGRTRSDVRAEAFDAVRSYRATAVAQFDGVSK